MNTFLSILTAVFLTGLVLTILACFAGALALLCKMTKDVW